METLALSHRETGLRGLIAIHSRRILLAFVAVIMGCLVIPPIGMVLWSSLRATENRLPFETTAYTITNIIHVFTSHTTYRLLFSTLYYGVGSLALAMALSVTFAWFLERTNLPFRRAMFVLILAPLGIPGIIKSMAWALLANPANGVVNMVLRGIFDLKGPGPLNIYTMWGMIFVTALNMVPMMYIMISGVFARVDPSFEEAGRTSGAGTWTTFRRISMPLLAPAVLAAAIYFAVVSIEIFEVAAMLGMPRGIFVFSTAIYYAMHPTTGLPNYGVASTYALLLLAVAGVLIYCYGRYVQNAERFATVTGRGYRPRLIDIGRWKYLPVAIIAVYFVLAVGLPFLILLWTSLAPNFSQISLKALSLLKASSYKEMITSPEVWKAVENTLVIASATATFGALLATLVSWLSVRGKIRGARLPDLLTFVILGIPGVVLGLALIFIYTAVPLPIYGTTWIIVIGLVTSSLPFGTRLMTAALLQIHRELEEAAAMSGAGLWNTFFRVVLPLLWPSFARGFLWMFVRSLRDTTIALVLYTAGNQTVSVMLFFLWVEEGDFRFASAVAVPIVIITMALTFLVARQTMLVKD